MKKFENFIGFDVSKSKLDMFIIYHNNEQKNNHFAFENSKEGLKKILSELSKLPVDLKQTLFCMEHTGVYTTPLCLFLEKHKLCYVLESGLQIKKSMGIRRGKNDKVDSKIIAEYACLHQNSIRLYQLPEKKLTILKHLIAHRERMITSRKSFQTAYKELSKFTNKKLISDVVKDSKGIIGQLNKKVSEIDKKILAIINEDEQLRKAYFLITSIPGIGPQIAINLIVITRCFTCFKNARQLACYAGIAPFEYSSGSSIKGKTRVSHLANKKVKSLLSMGALSAMKYDPEIKQYYQRKTKEGKNPMSVINAIRNKLVGRIFATINRGTPFVVLKQYAM